MSVEIVSADDLLLGYATHNIETAHKTNVHDSVSFKEYFCCKHPVLCAFVYDGCDDVPDYPSTDFVHWYGSCEDHLHTPEEFHTSLSSAFMSKLRGKLGKITDTSKMTKEKRLEALKYLKDLHDENNRGDLTMEQAGIINAYCRKLCDQGRDNLGKVPYDKKLLDELVHDAPRSEIHPSAKRTLDSGFEILEKYEENNCDNSKFKMDENKLLKLMTEYLCQIKDLFEILKAADKMKNEPKPVKAPKTPVLSKKKSSEKSTKASCPMPDDTTASAKRVETRHSNTRPETVVLLDMANKLGKADKRELIELKGMYSQLWNEANDHRLVSLGTETLCKHVLNNMIDLLSHIIENK
jgi:hypothetical protein